MEEKGNLKAENFYKRAKNKMIGAGISLIAGGVLVLTAIGLIVGGKNIGVQPTITLITAGLASLVTSKTLINSADEDTNKAQTLENIENEEKQA